MAEVDLARGALDAARAISDSIDAERGSMNRNRLKRLRQKRGRAVRKARELLTPEELEAAVPLPKRARRCGDDTRGAEGSRSSHDPGALPPPAHARARTTAPPSALRAAAASRLTCAGASAVAGSSATSAAASATAAAAAAAHARAPSAMGPGHPQRQDPRGAAQTLLGRGGARWAGAAAAHAQQQLRPASSAAAAAAAAAEEVVSAHMPLPTPWGGHADFSLVARLILAQSVSQQQPSCSPEGEAAAAAAAAAAHTAPPHDSERAPEATKGRPRARGASPADGSCSAAGGGGPCRSDLSGELLVVSQAMGAAAPGNDAGARGAPEAAASAGAPPLPHKGKKKSSFVWGNYHGYYNYRRSVGSDQEHDPRLTVLQRAWFEGKDVLDVGCNEGVVTLDMAALFCSRSMVGVDIDAALINRACRNLTAVRSELSHQLREAQAHRLQLSGPEWHQLRRRVKALSKVHFKAADWLAARCPAARYDTATCFSVTKWTHLHHGDAGVRRLFRHLHRCLLPGGVLVLEPQPWRSYLNAKHKQDLSGVPFAADVTQLRLRPAQFVDCLTQEFGFQLIGTFRVGADKAGAKGWDRPIHVLRKPGGEEAAAAAQETSGGDVTAPAAGGGVPAAVAAQGGAAAAGALAVKGARVEAAASSGGATAAAERGASSGSAGSKRSKGRAARKQRSVAQAAATSHFDQG